MPKVVAPLSEAAVRKLKSQGVYTVGGVVGLKLQVSNENSRSWILRATVAGKVRDHGLGSYPIVSLKAAREVAGEMKRQIQQGLDPLSERDRKKDELAAARASRKTFDDCAADYIASIEKKWKNPKTPAQWSSSLDAYATPIIGELAVSDITTAHIIKVLEPIWTTKTETASRVRGRIEAVLAYATTRGFRQGDNPARLKGHLDTLLPSASALKGNKHHPALSYCEIGRFMGDLKGTHSVAARALEFSILTAARSGEVRFAKWSEIDLHEAQWTIPADRMKAKKLHVVPLSKQAVSLLKTLQGQTDGEYVFPGQRAATLSDMTIAKVVKSLHKKAVVRGDEGYTDRYMENRVATPHGFRSTFRDWAGEQSPFPREVIEHALAHQLKDKAEAAYQRGSYLPKRTELMQAWADYCEHSGGKVAKVIPISHKRA
ncbi:MAG: tyrosine-type recombinase/integrase [Pseudomonadales bacterium]|nr:tyrosine-type recombinase/integrase [Pseudomonadales bacterium]